MPFPATVLLEDDSTSEALRLGAFRSGTTTSLSFNQHAQTIAWSFSKRFVWDSSIMGSDELDELDLGEK